MKVKCPKCGHEFEVEAIPISYPKVKPDMSGSSLVYRDPEGAIPIIRSKAEPDMSGSSVTPKLSTKARTEYAHPKELVQIGGADPIFREGDYFEIEGKYYKVTRAERWEKEV